VTETDAMKTRILALLFVLGLGAGAIRAQDAAAPQTSLDQAAGAVQRQLDDAIAELNRVRDEITPQKLALSRELAEQEAELARVRAEYQKVGRDSNASSLALVNLRTDNNRLHDQERYLSGLLGDYVRKFDSTLHIAETGRYKAALETATLAPENNNLSPLEVFTAQTDLIGASLTRIENALGGERYDGSAVDPTGVVLKGSFVQVGPVVVFRSADGSVVGSVEERLGSQEPTIFPYGDPANTAAASQLVASGQGLFPLDPTMGDALKMEETKETLVEHIEKGGPVMYPILGLAAAALLVALYKWLTLAFQRAPSRSKVDALLASVGQGDLVGAKEKVIGLKGPIGRMLAIGVEHLREPRELVEEAMFESVLTTRIKLTGMLPFIAIAASSAPLLGLLGTVTGIINTFKRITVFGSGDVKSLSGGISEALITTEFGLIVAIPALLMHAFLSRKAKAIVGQMESTAVAFVNQAAKAEHERANSKPNDRRPAPVKV